MKLTRQEILLLAALVFALAVGAVVKRYRLAHPVPPLAATPTPNRK
jgi:hypothetical protein